MDGSWHRCHPEMPAVQLFFKHVWCPVTGCQRSSWKLKLKWAGLELKWGAANYKMHLILLFVHVLCGREILEDRADWHLKPGKWLWGVEMNDKRHTRMGTTLSHCRLIPFIWFWHGYVRLFFSGLNCFTKRLSIHLFLHGPSMHVCGNLLFRVGSRAPKGCSRQSWCRSRYRLTPASLESPGGFLQHLTENSAATPPTPPCQKHPKHFPQGSRLTTCKALRDFLTPSDRQQQQMLIREATLNDAPKVPSPQK